MNEKNWPVPIKALLVNGKPHVEAGKYSTEHFELLRARAHKGKAGLYATYAHRFIDTSGVDNISYRDVKARNQWYSENLGTGFFKAWNGAMWKLWVGDDFKLLAKFCNGNRGLLIPVYVERFRQHETAIRTALADGLDHLVPLIIVFGLDPAGLKERLGKGLWKRLSHNTVSRNKLLAFRFASWCGMVRREPRHQVNAPEWDRTVLGGLAVLPSTILPKLGHFSPEHLEWITPYIEVKKQERALKKIKPDDLLRAVDIVSDTRRMATQVGKEFNPAWPYATMLKKHEEWTKEIMVRRFSPTPWDTFGWPEKIEQGEYTLTLLNNALALKEEGHAMYHCVGSYVDSARRGDVIIYSVRYKGERLSTLQFGISRCDYITQLDSKEPTFVRLGQHYGPCNRDIAANHKPTLNLVIGQLMYDMNKKIAKENLAPMVPVTRCIEPMAFAEWAF
jgi:hypothetical protein